MIRSNSECELPKTPSASRANLADVLKSPNSKPRYADRFVPSRAGKSWHLTFDETLPPVSNVSSIISDYYVMRIVLFINY